MKELLTVTVCGLLQIDVQADPNDPSDVLDSVYLVLNNLNVSLSAFELDCQPQVFTNALDKSDLSWEPVDSEE